MAEADQTVGPPPNEVGMPVSMQMLVHRSEQLAVVLTGFVAFRSGVQFDMVLRTPNAAIDLVEAWVSDGPRLTAELGDGRPLPLADLGGGGDDDSSLDLRHWLSPLPQSSSLTVVVDWPARSIAERVRVDVAPLAEAAQRSITLWP
jgi:hypothetical protein